MNPFDTIVILSLLVSMCTRTMSQSHYSTETNEKDSGSSNRTFNLGQLFPAPIDIQLEYGESKTSFGDRSRSQDTVAQHPYAVCLLIQAARDKNVFRVCSGSLLSAGWVMTSARCLGGCGPCAPAVYMCAGLPVVQANYDLRPEGAQCRKAVNAYVHPRYRPRSKNGDYDVAIVKANALFSLATKFIQVIQLSIKSFIENKIEKCVLSGFVRGQSKYDYEINVQNVEVKKPCIDDFKLSTLLDEAEHARNKTNERGGAQNKEQEQDFQKESGLDRYMCTVPEKGPGSELRPEMAGGALVCAGELTGIASSTVQLTSDSKNPIVPFVCTKKCANVPKMTVFQDICPHLRWINSLAQLFNSNDIPLECRGAAAHRYCATTQMLFLFIISLVLKFIR